MRFLLPGLLALLVSTGCFQKAIPSIAEFQEYPRARGNALSGYVGTGGAAVPGMVTVRFGNPLKTEDLQGTALPTRILHYRAKDKDGNPGLAKLRFIGLCRDGAARDDCYRLIDVSFTPE